MGELNPWTVLTAIFATFVTLTVGIEIASARNDAAMQLFGFCLGSTSPIAGAMTCGMGLLLLVVVPGTIGVLVIAFAAVR